MGRPKNSGTRAAPTGFVRVPADLGRMLVAVAGHRGTSVAVEIDPYLRPAVLALAKRRTPLPADRVEAKRPVAQVKVAADLAYAVRKLRLDKIIPTIPTFIGATVRAGVESLHLAVAEEAVAGHRQAASAK